MITKEIRTQLFADYFQFYIQDELVTGDISDAWSQYAVDTRLALAPGTIGISTARNMNVPVIVKFFDGDPGVLIVSDETGQINECDLESSSNKLVIAGCTDYFRDALRIEVEIGIYRVRIYYRNMDKLSEDELEGDDTYELHLWLANKKEPVKILKGKHALQ